MNDAALSENFTATIAHRNVLFLLSFHGSPPLSVRPLSAYLTVGYLSPAISGHMRQETRKLSWPCQVRNTHDCPQNMPLISRTYCLFFCQNIL